MDNFTTINILDMNEVVGEDNMISILSDFSCPKNKEIEHYIQNLALKFAKKKMSITYLVVDEDGYVVGIFTLTHKVVEVKNSILSNSVRKKLLRFSRLNEETDSFTVSAFLIAQFGKNYASPNSVEISGTRLMDLTFDVLKKVQHDIGGGLVFLECEDKDNLLDFYQSEQNGFKIFGERYSENDDVKYIQLLKMF